MISKKKIFFSAVVSAMVLVSSLSSYAQEISGYISSESRLFPEEALNSAQHSEGNIAFSFEPEFYYAWNDGYQSFTFTPFFRLDQNDDERTHVDIRELYWQKISDIWELRVGIRKVFWGVTESTHLVDIINQTDAVENFDGEDKLGQPMVNLAIVQNWGTLDLFLLTGFRERTFPGIEGRLRSPLVVDVDKAEYESGAEDKRLDWAVRWSRTIQDFDIGLTHFSGTSREPNLIFSLDNNNNPTLIPRYELIDQTGLDLQATKGAMLWKLELISRDTNQGRFTAFNAGLEYTYGNVKETGADIGVIFEYLYDDRGENAPNPFENDMFFGTRLALNDVQSTDFLGGIIVDSEDGGTAYLIESSRRFGESWKVNFEVRGFFGIDSKDIIYGLRKDSHLQLEIARYF